MAGPSNEDRDVSNSLGSLLDPECGIPFDVYFDLEDDKGTKLGTEGGHKNILALKSPVFKTMFFGSLPETGSHIQIKATSKKAFKTMLKYVHDVEEELYPWSLDTREMFLISDLAQRYDLAGLQEKIIKYAEGFIFPEERLIEIARTAEEYKEYEELSNTLLDTCAKMLLAVFEAPNDPQAFAAKWSKPGTSTEDSVTALRLLGRVDGLNLAFINYPWGTARVISHLRNIKLAIKPRARLQAIINHLGQSNTIHETLDTLYKHSTVCDFLKSLSVCQSLDVEKAAREGVRLALDTPVEDRPESDLAPMVEVQPYFTHEESIKLHLDLMRLQIVDPVDRRWEQWEQQHVSLYWTEVLRAIPEVRMMMLVWLQEKYLGGCLTEQAKHFLRQKFLTCGDDLKQLPGFWDFFERWVDENA